MIAVIHTAGPYVGFVQKCMRCGATLTDHTNSAWPADQEPPSGYREGADLGVIQGNPRVTYEVGGGWDPGATEQRCAPRQ